MKLIRNILITILFLFGITALIAVGLYTYHNKEKKLLTDTDRKPVSGQFIKLSQGVTHYQLGGPDTGKLVILIHGYSVPYYIWDGTYQYLLKQGFRVLRYDQYGRGYSDRPQVNYNKQLYFDQLNELIKYLHINTSVNLIGVSFGGMIATDFTCQYPELIDKVILIDPGYSSLKHGLPPSLAYFTATLKSDEQAKGQLTDFKYPDRHPNWVSKYLVQMQYKGFRHALISTSYNYNYNGRKSNRCLNTKHKPVLLIWGKEDNTVPFTFSDSVRSELKVEFFPVDDAGHMPYLEQPDKVNPKIAAFLRLKE